MRCSCATSATARRPNAPEVADHGPDGYLPGTSDPAMNDEPRGSFRLEERQDGDRTVLAAHGELDLATVDVVRARLDALRAERRPVVLDLDALAFIDSTGIRLVLQAAEDRNGSGWDFTITHGSPTVRHVFASASIEDRLPYADEAGA
jgi:anti-anti-sigma factor